MSSGFVFRDEEAPAPFDERRSGERVVIETEVSFASDSQFFTGLTGNLSTGGVFIATYRALPIGCDVTLHIDMPDGELVAKGQVRWARDAASGGPPGLGVAFDPLDSATIDRIARFCDARDPLLHDGD